MSEKIEINTLITKHENKCKGCRFEMVTVEDPLWEYGTHFKQVLQDNQTGKQYRAVSRLVGLLNELSDENRQLKEENERLKETRMNDAKEFSALYKQNYGFKRENEQLKQELNECANHKLYSRRQLEKENKMLKLQTYCQDQYIKKLELEQKALLEQLETQNI